MVLTGSEVKALREAKARLDDAFGRVVRGELWLIGLHIPPYRYGHGFGSHDPHRQRKLLAHRGEILRWQSIAEQQHLTMVPLELRFVEGRVKVELGLAKGRKTYDKRQALAKRDADLEARKALAQVVKRTGALTPLGPADAAGREMPAQSGRQATELARIGHETYRGIIGTHDRGGDVSR